LVPVTQSGQLELNNSEVQFSSRTLHCIGRLIVSVVLERVNLLRVRYIVCSNLGRVIPDYMIGRVIPDYMIENL